VSGGSESTGARPGVEGRSQKAAIPRCTSTSVLWRSGKSSQNALHTLEGKQPRSMHACLAAAAAGKPRRRGALSISPLSIADQLWVEHL